MKFNEDSRVKIPTILHLIRLGYQYLSLKDQHWDVDTNIFTDLFISAILRINPSLQPVDAKRQLEDIKLKLDNEDLGKAFFEQLTDRSNIKLIDFENFNNNSFHVVTELSCQNGDDEFRPDITLLINGMPLVFIEVKKPNNREGILAERDRINTRFQNPKFKRFANITQFMIFSNNMEYDDGDPEPVQGAFYASSSYYKPVFNYFREEEIFNLTSLLKPISDEEELSVLKDTNLEVIRYSPEFQTNKQPDRPTNRICTSLLNRERLSFILRYALTYVSQSSGPQKHIMRYPQLFATKAIEQKLDEGVRKGIIWHTQGSGKTALAFYNVRFLTDYFQKRQIIPKFYFIVDRLDLLQQAQSEFIARGLTVHAVNSREDFARDIKATQVIHNHSGKPEITVVNIQKFKDDPDVVSTQDYNIAIQRVYFLDEVHRSYNPKGSFLANLSQSDTNAIKIGLTGTPLLGDDYNSRALFGDYIHKYYYNASIADGYTLRLIREEISTQYKLELQKALAEAEVEMGDVDRKLIYAHPSFVEPMLNYIISDFVKSRGALNDASIGAMVVCDSSNQAKQMFELFNQYYAEEPVHPDFAKLNVLYRETSNHLDLLNLKHNLESGQDTSNLLNRALEDVVFQFVKIGEEELVLADQLKNTLRQTREALASNFDQQDPEFITLKEELERLFKKKKLSEVTQAEMTDNISALNKIHERVKELNRKNSRLKQKYQGDTKYTRIHKRLQERGSLCTNERKIHQALMGVKLDADEQVLNNTQILFHESYFERQMMPLVIHRFMNEQEIKLNADTSKYINHLLVSEYLHEFNTGATAW